MKTVNVYIDGYNFYYSISKERETLPLGWCNFLKLADRLAFRAFGGRYALGAVKYYTATVSDRAQHAAGEIERQKLWLEALDIGTGGKVVVVKGYYKPPDKKAGRQEKQTDTNIVVGMIRDALLPAPFTRPLHNDTYAPCDAVILMSGDKDFKPAVEMIRREHDKQVAVFYQHNYTGPLNPENGIEYRKVTIEDLEHSKLDDPVRWAEYRRLKRLA